MHWIQGNFLRQRIVHVRTRNCSCLLLRGSEPIALTAVAFFLHYFSSGSPQSFPFQLSMFLKKLLVGWERRNWMLSHWVNQSNENYRFKLTFLLRDIRLHQKEALADRVYYRWPRSTLPPTVDRYIDRLSADASAVVCLFFFNYYFT